MHITGWLFSGLIFILTGAFLELNKHTLPGWVLFTILTAGMIWAGVGPAKKMKRPGRALCPLGYLALCAVILLASWPPVKRVPASDGESVHRTAVYATAGGDVRGVVLQSGVELFAGVPYAAPPVGDLRWKKPRDAEKWSGVLECDSFAPMSMQSQSLPIVDSLSQIIGYHDYSFSLKDDYRQARSEDSLYLNIWRPSGEVEGAPVAVYIHGGSLKTGQPWYRDYSGEGFAKDGIIVVNMGYRLGVFGFLCTEEMLREEGTGGNFGLLDQIKALEWVRDNIASFGGDPHNVTLIGESAGAVCVDALCASPLAEGLFKRAILESSTLSSVSPPHSFRSLDAALSSGAALMQRYGCTGLDDLRRIPAEKLAGGQETEHHVTVDGFVLTDTPHALRMRGIHNEEALLHGYNAEESGPFILFSRADLKNYEGKVRAWAGSAADEILRLYDPATDAEADEYWARIYGAVFFNYPHYCLDRLAKKTGEPAWEYLFARDNGRLGCWHSGEMVYAFGTIPEDSRLYTEEDRRLSDMMHAFWCGFIRNGDPNSGGFSGFEQSPDSSSVMVFGTDAGMAAEPDLALYGILDRMYGWDTENAGT